MKQINYFKKTLLLLAMVAGVSTAWADPAATFSIPQNLGSYILVGNDNQGGSGLTADGVTLTGCKVDGSGSCYTVGSTNGSTVTIQLAFTAEAGKYLFSFKSGHKEGTSELSLSLTNSGSTEIWNNNGNNVTIAQTSSSWTPVDLHAFDLGELEAGTYTLTITGVSKTGSNYYGNFGNFSFHKSTQYATSWNNSANIIFTDAYNTGNSINTDWINGITVNSYVEFYTYTPNDGYYYVNGTFGYATADTDNFTLTVTDVATSTTEVNAVNYIYKKSPDNYPITSELTAGWKKIRITFPGPTITGSFRCQGMRFGACDALPLTGTTTLDLNQSQVIFYHCSYQDDEKYPKTIGSIKGETPYADNYYVANMNEPAYYDVKMNINYHNTNGTKVKVTITDIATDSEETIGTSDEINSTGVIQFSLNNPISPGVKKIRFDFISETTNAYLINITDVSFYKRSLNENYAYTPVAATGVDVVLTRNITAGNWSTICLPFAMTNAQLKSAFGEYVKVAELTSGTSETLNFSTVTETAANKPYAIKVASDFTSATISDVTIVSATPTQSVTYWDFVGTYSLVENMASGNYYFKSNKLWQATGSQKMKPFRGYFHYTGTAATAREVTFSIDEEVTGIAHIDADGQMTMNEGVAYDLQGRKVAQPTRGMYIVNGKKVIIK